MFNPVIYDNTDGTALFLSKLASSVAWWVILFPYVLLVSREAAARVTAQQR